MTWEDPDTLLKKKLGREEYIQRMLTSLVLGRSYPRWNTRNIPSGCGDKFLRELHKQAFGTKLVDKLEFVDELELLSNNDEDANGAPDYAVFTKFGVGSLSSRLKQEAIEVTNCLFMHDSRVSRIPSWRFQSPI